jgi:hypothetical protein
MDKVTETNILDLKSLETKAIRIIVATIGVVLGVAGLDHGIFEVLQGSTPTNGLIIQAIGGTNRMWLHGTEEAFTIIPNFLMTGILAILVSIVIIVWSVGFIHRKYGAKVFALLFILLFLVGGGIAAQIMFVPITWWVATHINKPLFWRQKVLPKKARSVLGKLWPITLTVGVVSFLIGLEIAVFGYVPGLKNNDPELILMICWLFIFGGGLGMFLLTFIGGFAHDSLQQETNRVF